MASQQTYGKFCELVLTTYYKKSPSDNSNYTTRIICEWLCEEIAYFAKADAIEADKMGENVYANDQFITTYNGLPLLTDTNGNRYITMPSQPAGLPKGREIAYVAFTGNSTIQAFPIRNKNVFVQQFLTNPFGMIQYYVENNNIMFRNISTNIAGPVDLKMVAGIPTGDNLMILPLNMPKSWESPILDKLLARMNQIRQVLPDNVNDNVSK